MKNLKEIISQLDTVTPCVLNPLFLRHKSSGPFACIHVSVSAILYSILKIKSLMIPF